MGNSSLVYLRNEHLAFNTHTHVCVCVCVCVYVCVLWFFFKERASSRNSLALGGFKPSSSGLVPLPYCEADTHIGLPSFSSTWLAPLPRALALTATSSQDCLPGQLLPLRLWEARVQTSLPIRPSTPSGQVLPLCSESLVPPHVQCVAVSPLGARGRASPALPGHVWR